MTGFYALARAWRWAWAAASFTAHYAATYRIRDEELARLGAAGLFVPIAELHAQSERRAQIDRVSEALL